MKYWDLLYERIRYIFRVVDHIPGYFIRGTLICVKYPIKDKENRDMLDVTNDIADVYEEDTNTVFENVW